MQHVHFIDTCKTLLLFVVLTCRARSKFFEILHLTNYINYLLNAKLSVPSFLNFPILFFSFLLDSLFSSFFLLNKPTAFEEALLYKLH